MHFEVLIYSKNIDFNHVVCLLIDYFFLMFFLYSEILTAISRQQVGMLCSIINQFISCAFYVPFLCGLLLLNQPIRTAIAAQPFLNLGVFSVIKRGKFSWAYFLVDAEYYFLICKHLNLLGQRQLSGWKRVLAFATICFKRQLSISSCPVYLNARK